MATKEMNDFNEDLKEGINHFNEILDKEIDEDISLLDDAKKVQMVLAKKQILKKTLKGIEIDIGTHKNVAGGYLKTTSENSLSTFERIAKELKELAELEASISNKIKKEAKHLQKDDEHSINTIKVILNRVKDDAERASIQR